MGLLDVLNSDEGRMGLALLAAGAPRLDGAGFGQRLNEAVGSFDQYKSGQDAASFKKLQADALRQELLGRQNAATEAARLRGLMQSDMSYQDMVRQGVPVEQVKALAESRNFGRDEVARTTEIEGPGGQKIIQGFDKFNNPIGAGVAGYVAPQLVNQGDRQAFVKPSAGLSLPVGMSPSERDASARGWASNNLAAQRLAFEQAGGAEANKPQLVDGQWIYKPSAQNPQGMVVPVAGFNAKPPVELNKAIVGLNELDKYLETYKQTLADQGGPSVVATGEKRAALKSAYTTLQMGLKNAFELGALAGPDLEILQGMFVDPTSANALIYGKKGIQEQINKGREFLTNRASAVYGAHNKEVPNEFKPNVVTLSDITATAKASGRTTAEVTAALKAKGYTIGGQ